MRIKCPHCNGKGFLELNSAMNMTCGWCMGQGELDLEIVPTEPQTNEEWLNSMTTEEKADWLDKVAENCCQICDKENRELCRGNIATGCKFENAKKWEMWLKQPHTFK